MTLEITVRGSAEKRYPAERAVVAVSAAIFERLSGFLDYWAGKDGVEIVGVTWDVTAKNRRGSCLTCVNVCFRTVGGLGSSPYRKYGCGMAWKRFRTRFGGLSRLGYRTGARTRLLLPRRLGPRRLGPMRGVYREAVLHDTYSVRARLIQRAARLFIQPVLRFAPRTDTTIRTFRALDRASAKSPRSRYVEPIGYELGGVRVESMTHRFGPTSGATILYFHGGGFMSCGIETHRRLCERLARHTGAEVISVDYVQLPDGAIPDSVQDAMTAYVGLLDICLEPDKIVVAGDSAGGYLAMKVAELATRRGLQPPAAILGFSPMLSLDPDREDKAVERIDSVNDAFLPPKRLPRIRALWLPDDSTIEGFASPLHAAAYINSPVFMTAVEDELLRPEVEKMALLLADRGLEVETHIWRKQVHAFPVLADFLPESKHAIALAADFVRIAVGEMEREKPVDEEVLVGEVNDAAPDAPSEEEFIDGVVVNDKPGRWFSTVS